MSTIVVGIDGSHGAVEALKFAIEEARVRGAEVKAVAAWEVPASAYGMGVVPIPVDPSAYEKIRRIKAMLGTRPVDLSVDGGVKRDHVRPLADAGVTVLVAGSAIFGAADPPAVVKEMKRLALP